MSAIPIPNGKSKVPNITNITTLAQTGPLHTQTQKGPPIIAFCQLHWNGVWQRPQQFLSRLSERHSILFVETHCTNTINTKSFVRSVENYPEVTILEIHLPISKWSNGKFIDDERRRELQESLQGFDGKYDSPILWFNDPMAVTAYAGELG